MMTLSKDEVLSIVNRNVCPIDEILMHKIQKYNIVDLVLLAKKNQNLANLMLCAMEVIRDSLSEAIDCPGEATAILGKQTVVDLAMAVYLKNTSGDIQAPTKESLLSIFLDKAKRLTKLARTI